MSQSFLFVSNIGSFEESAKGLTCTATFMVLDKVSENGRRYNFEDAEAILKSLLWSPIRLGITAFGKHKKQSRQIGTVTDVFMEGKTVKGKIRVTASDIIAKLKAGAKYLLSVGGKALGVLIAQGKKVFMSMKNPKVTHVQMFSIEEGKAGFPEAKIESIEESVLFAGEKSIALLIGADII